MGCRRAGWWVVVLTVEGQYAKRLVHHSLHDRASRAQLIRMLHAHAPAHRVVAEARREGSRGRGGVAGGAPGVALKDAEGLRAKVEDGEAINRIGALRRLSELHRGRRLRHRPAHGNPLDELPL
ncbi:MAG: hypothetical protein AAFZ18_30795, partial [Myxococcota bacterium]